MNPSTSLRVHSEPFDPSSGLRIESRTAVEGFDKLRIPRSWVPSEVEGRAAKGQTEKKERVEP